LNFRVKDHFCGIPLEFIDMLLQKIGEMLAFIELPYGLCQLLVLFLLYSHNWRLQILDFHRIDKISSQIISFFSVFTRIVSLVLHVTFFRNVLFGLDHLVFNFGSQIVKPVFKLATER
jgi:hypothetical protein